MQIGQRTVRNLNAPPNWRFDFEQRDLELEEKIGFAGRTAIAEPRISDCEAPGYFSLRALAASVQGFTCVPEFYRGQANVDRIGDKQLRSGDSRKALVLWPSSIAPCENPL